MLFHIHLFFRNLIWSMESSKTIFSIQNKLFEGILKFGKQSTELFYQERYKHGVKMPAKIKLRSLKAKLLGFFPFLLHLTTPAEVYKSIYIYLDNFLTASILMDWETDYKIINMDLIPIKYCKSFSKSNSARGDFREYPCNFLARVCQYFCFICGFLDGFPI